MGLFTAQLTMHVVQRCLLLHSKPSRLIVTHMLYKGATRAANIMYEYNQRGHTAGATLSRCLWAPNTGSPWFGSYRPQITCMQETYLALSCCAELDHSVLMHFQRHSHANWMPFWSLQNVIDKVKQIRPCHNPPGPRSSQNQPRIPLWQS